MVNIDLLTAGEQQEYLALAIRAAKRAGEFLADLRHGHIEVAEENSKDIKLVADRQSENIIVDELLSHSTFHVLAEEGGGYGNNKSDYMWIVDPLDGSVNFLENIPQCCVSIGLWQGTTPVLGAIYDFNRGETYSGIVNEGAWLDGKPITVKSVRSVDKSILCTGFPAATNFESESILSFIEQVKAFRKVRMIGSAAMSLAYVASGKVDAYFEENIKIWDVAAGVAIVKAAGGFTKFEDRDQHNYNVFAASGELLDI